MGQPTETIRTTALATTVSAAIAAAKAHRKDQ